MRSLADAPGKPDHEPVRAAVAWALGRALAVDPDDDAGDVRDAVTSPGTPPPPPNGRQDDRRTSRDPAAIRALLGGGAYAGLL